MIERSRDYSDPYHYDLDAACRDVVGRREGSDMNPAVLRVPVTPGGAGVDPLRVQFNVDPRELGLEIRTLYASDFARAALERGRELGFALGREEQLKRELAALRGELDQERKIVARFEVLTGIRADRLPPP